MIRQRAITVEEVQDPVRLAARLNQLLDGGIAHMHGATFDVSRTVRAQDRAVLAGPVTIPVGVAITVLGRMLIL